MYSSSVSLSWLNLRRCGSYVLLDPDVPRQRVPGGYFGLVLVTVGPVAIISLAIYSQFAEEGFSSLGWALVFMAVGAILYFPFRRYLKPGVPDVDPFASPPEEA